MATPIVHEGELWVGWVETIADTSAPTTTELGTAVDLTPALTADGWAPNHTENTVSTDMLTGFIRQSIGTEGIGFDLTFLRFIDTATDNEAFDLFDERGKVGFLVVASTGGVAPVSADTVEVYPVEAGRRKRMASGANAHQKFTVKFVGNENYVDDAVVAA
jgi:hypothetical protein